MHPRLGSGHRCQQISNLFLPLYCNSRVVDSKFEQLMFNAVAITVHLSSSRIENPFALPLIIGHRFNLIPVFGVEYLNSVFILVTAGKLTR